MMRARVLAALWLFASAAAACRADRDIVFSARFYYPPYGPRRESHFSLYRINPDGTGLRRVTSGAWDDQGPLWSPDGKRVLFLRHYGEYGSASSVVAICVVGASGGSVTQLLRLPDDDAYTCAWSPDGRTVTVTAVAGDWVRLIDVAARRSRKVEKIAAYLYSPEGSRRFVVRSDGSEAIVGPGAKETAVRYAVIHPVWLSRDTVVGIGEPDQAGESIFLRFIGADGKERRRVAFRPASDDAQDAITGGPYNLSVVPPDGRRLVYWELGGSSTAHFYALYRMSAATGEMSHLADGTFLAWSTDGRRFCTAPARDLAPYGRRRDGTVRKVWVAPLQIGDERTARVRDIVRGRVWAVGGDWRRAPHGRAHRSRPPERRATMWSALARVASRQRGAWLESARDLPARRPAARPDPAASAFLRLAIDQVARACLQRSGAGAAVAGALKPLRETLADAWKGEEPPTPTDYGSLDAAVARAPGRLAVAVTLGAVSRVAVLDTASGRPLPAPASLQWMYPWQARPRFAADGSLVVLSDEVADMGNRVGLRVDILARRHGGYRETRRWIVPRTLDRGGATLDGWLLSLTYLDLPTSFYTAASEALFTRHQVYRLTSGHARLVRDTKGQPEVRLVDSWMARARRSRRRNTLQRRLVAWLPDREMLEGWSVRRTGRGRSSVLLRFDSCRLRFDLGMRRDQPAVLYLLRQ